MFIYPHSHPDSPHSHPNFLHSPPDSPQSYCNSPHSHPDSLHSHPDSPHPHPDSRHSHPDSPRSHPNSPRSHNSLHYASRFPIPAFTDSRQTSRSFSLLMLFTDNKWFESPWGCYLIKSATLAFITFKISEHSTFVEWSFWNFSEPSNSNMQ